MKLASLLATATLLLTPVLHAQEPKEVVEVNLSYTLKFQLQQPPFVQGDNTVNTARVFTIKTADIIRLIGQKEAKVFSKKARLFYTYTTFDIAAPEVKYLIRDDATDHDVTPYIGPFSTFFTGQVYQITKGKLNVTTGLGKASQLSTITHDIALAGGLNSLTQGFELVGPGTVSYKVVNSTKLTTTTPLIVPVASFVVSGRAIEVDGNSGFVSGTVKLTGPKLLK